MDEELINKIREKIQPFFQNQGGHGFDHTERVYNYALTLSEKENVNLKIIKIASLLHDIARSKEDNNECKDHAEEGARIAEEILKQENISQEEISHIKDCIISHRFSKGIKPRTKEAEIIQDADRLDALGAICVARVFMYNGLHKLPLHIPGLKPEEEYRGQETTAINHFYEKVLKIKPETFNTRLARNIAKQRYNFILKFLKQFHEEWAGKK